jgi:hypothetical protein
MDAANCNWTLLSAAGAASTRKSCQADRIIPFDELRKRAASEETHSGMRTGHRDASILHDEVHVRVAQIKELLPIDPVRCVTGKVVIAALGTPRNPVPPGMTEEEYQAAHPLLYPPKK